MHQNHNRKTLVNIKNLFDKRWQNWLDVYNKNSFNAYAVSLYYWANSRTTALTIGIRGKSPVKWKSRNDEGS